VDDSKIGKTKHCVGVDEPQEIENFLATIPSDYWLGKNIFRILCTLSFLVMTYIILESQTSPVQASTVVSDKIPGFNFAAVGDWGCNSDTEATVVNIRNKNPELVLALGDLSTEQSADCWLEIIKTIDSITRINIGNHEDKRSEDFTEYMNHFGLTKPYYSYNYQNVHIYR
jgi:hypothetical protein